MAIFTRLAVGAVLLSSICRLAESRFIVEKGGLKIRYPAAAASQHPNGFDMSLGNFGSPLYGGTLMGELVYIDPNHGFSNTCSPACNFACQPYNESSPPLHLEAGALQKIMLIDRGPQGYGGACKFTDKTWNAQQAGAHAVLVVNYDDSETTMEAPDDDDFRKYAYLGNISIPAAFITQTTGQVLKDLLLNGHTEDAVVILDWTDVLERAETVEWEFWSNSNDQCGTKCEQQAQFIREFAPAAKELEGGNFTRFAPHYLTYQCPSPNRGDCGNQCIHQGRYCQLDPDSNLMEGYSGGDVVEENLRQLCVFKLANESGQPWQWWTYVTKFADECKMADNKYNESCAEAVFQEIGGTTWSTLEKFKECSGGVNEDRANPVLEAELAGQRGDEGTGEVYILPTIRINGDQYRGKLGYTEVLRALCSGFNSGQEPAACLRVAQDDCVAGSPGDLACKANVNNGKTKCVNTFSSYECQCGSGFIESKDQQGNLTCLNINECAATRLGDLEPACSCERCACKDTFGGHECISNLADECAVNNGGCWSGEYKVNGQKKNFSACFDNIAAYKEAAKNGMSVLPPLHTCQCPPCFTEFVTNGVMTCEPKCSLGTCEEATGICTAASSSGTPVWAVLLIVVVGLAAVSGAAYAVYMIRIRQATRAEVRAIMSEYMPLEATDSQANGDTWARGPGDATP